MGLDTNGIRLVLLAKRLGADFKDVVTIGRQELHLTQAQLQKELANFNVPCPGHFASGDNSYSESFFSLLGARDTQAIDNSDYENATIVHDMNNHLPEHFKGKFSVVVDAGTLEHVFNYPVALKNSMELLRKGGFFISITPANNFMGHGFYQFSPELFFSVFTSENGFELIKLLVCETYDDAQWYEVSKPKGGIHGRVTLINHHPTYLMCLARRLNDKCEPFKTTPQQSDYIEAWGHSSHGEGSLDVSNAKKSWFTNTAKVMLKHVPGIMPLVRNFRYTFKPTYPERHYTPIDLNNYYNTKDK